MPKIGPSDLNVFPLALGGNVFGWTVDQQHANVILDKFLAGGGNLIDSADMYSEWVPGNNGGVSEQIIGNWLQTRSRGDVVVATKVAKYSRRPGLSPSNIHAAADESLARLGTDYIDLYYAHQEDPDTPIEQSAEAFNDLVSAGKVKAIGLSNFSAEATQVWIRVAKANNWATPVALQPHYNLVHRNEYEEDLSELAVRENLSVLPYYALASGFLTGKYRQRITSGDSPRAEGASQYATDQGVAIIDTLHEIANAHDATIATTALAWLLAKPQVVAPIASASKPEQVDGLLDVARVQLTPEQVAELDAVSTWNG